MTALAIAKRGEIINKLASGKFLRDIAAKYKVTPAAISQYLSKDPEYVAAREEGIGQQLDKWQKEIETAGDALKLARAREAFRATAWRAEREFPGRWAQRNHVTVEHVGDLAERLRRARERVIDADSVATEQHAALLQSPAEEKSSTDSQ
jgi:uncharacterized membrane protein YccC